MVTVTGVGVDLIDTPKLPCLKGGTFSKAHHFGALHVGFRECRLPRKGRVQGGGSWESQWNLKGTVREA